MVAVEVQTYLFGMVLAIAVPSLLFWLLRAPLREFLREIFHAPAVEQFWLRVVLIGFVALTLSIGLVFHPVDLSKSDEVALAFNVADKLKQMLDSLLAVMFATFLPLLAAYTILHVPTRGKAPKGRRRSQTHARNLEVLCGGADGVRRDRLGLFLSARRPTNAARAAPTRATDRSAVGPARRRS